MAKKLAHDHAEIGSEELLLDDRFALDAMRALDALEEQFFGDPLDGIVTARAIGAKRQRLLHEEEDSI